MSKAEIDRYMVGAATLPFPAAAKGELMSCLRSWRVLPDMTRAPGALLLVLYLAIGWRRTAPRPA